MHREKGNQDPRVIGVTDAAGGTIEGQNVISGVAISTINVIIVGHITMQNKVFPAYA